MEDELYWLENENDTYPITSGSETAFIEAHYKIDLMHDIVYMNNGVIDVDPGAMDIVAIRCQMFYEHWVVEVFKSTTQKWIHFTFVEYADAESFVGRLRNLRINGRIAANRGLGK